MIDMEIWLKEGKEGVLRILQDLGIRLLGVDHPVTKEIHESCAGLRSGLGKARTAQKPPPLVGGSFWDIAPTYRLDVLVQDVPKIADQLAYAIGFSSLYLPQVAKSKIPYRPTLADDFFWYHIDFGIRLASSGWDRIALLLDLAFSLNSGTECSFRVVLRELRRKHRWVLQDANFRALEQFRDNKFLKLEAGAGSGARHETTHLLSPSTRFVFEFLEDCRNVPQKVPLNLKPKAWRDMLVEHHKLYVSGIQSANGLVSSCNKRPTGQ